MALSDNPRNYPHVREILDEAVARGGVRYTLPNEAKATHWRMLAYHLRKLIQKEHTARADLPKGVNAPTPYDSMYITLEGATVVLQFRKDNEGTLTTLDKKPINERTKKAEPVVTDEFVEIAQDVKKDLGL